jgi:Cof subfamily protein (haloacid dehalogenase superfamily)
MPSKKDNGKNERLRKTSADSHALVVFDLDGTLVDEQLHISEEDLLSIQRIRQLNVRVTLATGRTYLSARPFVQQLDIEYPVILCNGACIFDHISSTILFERRISKETALFAIRKSIELGLEPLVYEEPINALPSVSVLTNVMKHYLQPERFSSIQVTDLKSLIEKTPPIKVQVVGDREALQDLKQSISDTYPESQVVMTQDNYLEIVPSGLSKGDALRRLCSIGGIRLSRTVSFGDALNDAEMLRLAGKGIAIGNAPRSLRDIADETFSDVATALQAIFFNGG